MFFWNVRIMLLWKTAIDFRKQHSVLTVLRTLAWHACNYGASRDRPMLLCANTHSNTVTSFRSNFISRLMMLFADRSASHYQPLKTHAICGTSKGRPWNEFRCRINLGGFWFLPDEWSAVFIWVSFENSIGNGKIFWLTNQCQHSTTDILTWIWRRYIPPKYVKYISMYPRKICS